MGKNYSPGSSVADLVSHNSTCDYSSLPGHKPLIKKTPQEFLLLTDKEQNEYLDYINLNLNGGKTMAKLIDEAKNYEGSQTGNIADLPNVPTDIEVFDKTSTNEEGKEFSYKAVTVNGKDYRVPASVLDQLKAQLQANPNIKNIRVIKSGAGMGTKYTVVALG